MGELTDEELMALILEGHRQALAPLVQRYQRPLFAYLYRLGGGDRMLADDLVQDTFVRLLKQRTYRPERPFRPWLYAIATNLAREHFRSPAHRLRVPSGEQVLLGLGDPTPGPEACAVHADQGLRVRQAIGGLAEEYRATFLLRFYGGLSLREIAEALEVPLGTVKSRLSVGVRRLRDLVLKEETQP